MKEKFKFIKKVTTITICLLFISGLVYAHTDTFKLDKYNTSYSSKGNLWYYSGSFSIDVGVQNFSGGKADFSFKKVNELYPDSTLVRLKLDSINGSYFSGVANVNDQSSYYYEVDRISGNPAGSVFAK